MVNDDPPQLRQPRESVDTEITERIRLGAALRAEVGNIHTEGELREAENAFKTWNELNRELLRRRFTTAEFAEEYGQPSLRVRFVDASLTYRARRLDEDLDRQVRRLESIKERLHLCEEPSTPPPKQPAANGDAIFIVHGRDDARKETIARLLQEASDRSVLILHEQPDGARTVIEKLEQLAPEAAFAVVLLTADDVGGLAGVDGEMKPRARQNVIFEAGYFMRALGRDRVVLLYEEGVELPSDMGGILYSPLDAAGAWRMKLGRELKAAGIDFDAEVLMR